MAVPSWFAIHVKPNAERAAWRRLRDQCFEVYLPLLTVRRAHNGCMRERRLPLFPGYVLLLLDIDGADERWKSIGNTRGVISLLPTTENPMPIARGQVFDLLRKENRGLFRIGDVRAGDDVQVFRGTLADQVLRVLESKGDRVRCLWHCLGAQRVVDLRVADVQVLR